MQILEFRREERGHLKGSLDVQVPEWGGLIIENISFFQKDNRKWINLPARKVEKDGKPHWQPLIRFEDPSVMKKFSLAVLELIEGYFKQ